MNITKKEDKLTLDVEEVTFMSTFHKKLPQTITPEEETVSLKVRLYRVGLNFYGNVKLTKKEYTDNITNIENYVLDKYIINKISKTQENENSTYNITINTHGCVDKSPEELTKQIIEGIKKLGGNI